MDSSNYQRSMPYGYMDKVINKDSKMDANEEWVLPNTWC